MATTTIQVAKIELVYVCTEEGCTDEFFEQPLADIVSVGTLICPECGEDMELTDAVNVKDTDDDDDEEIEDDSELIPNTYYESADRKFGYTR